jgi:hypothetical protein
MPPIVSAGVVIEGIDESNVELPISIIALLIILLAPIITVLLSTAIVAVCILLTEEYIAIFALVFEVDNFI